LRRACLLWRLAGFSAAAEAVTYTTSQVESASSLDAAGVVVAVLVARVEKVVEEATFSLAVTELVGALLDVPLDEEEPELESEPEPPSTTKSMQDS
jgi:hypothetical protein